MTTTLPMTPLIRFWGVRGSIPTPAADKLCYGGNTPCIEIKLGSETLLFDAGTGIARFSEALQQPEMERAHRFHLFFSHFHWDHIQGLPFFSPLYRPGTHLSFYSGSQESVVQGVMRRLMGAPGFPVEWEQTLSAKTFTTVANYESTCLAGATVTAFPLHHPGGASGYRIQSNGSVIVYASDFEHGNPELDQVLREQAKNADVLIYDAQYTPEEYELSHRGWGHSTWREAVRIAQDCAVKRLILFHHDPRHSDSTMEKILVSARAEFAAVEIASEGQSVAC